MNVRGWQDILREVVEADVDPQGWRAVGGRREHGIGEDLYFGHPRAGVFQLKTYPKNPFDVRGVGTRVARRVDEDIEPLFPDRGRGRFAVGPRIADEDEAKRRARDVEEVLKTHADAPTTPDALFEDVMGAMRSPAFGPMEYDGYERPDAAYKLADEFDEAERLLEADFADIVAESNRGFQ